jgi:homoserine O-acetyltransferase
MAKIAARFQLASYKMMNQLLKTIDITRNSLFEKQSKLEAEIHIIAINSDCFYSK